MIRVGTKKLPYAFKTTFDGLKLKFSSLETHEIPVVERSWKLRIKNLCGKKFTIFGQKFVSTLTMIDQAD